MNQVWQKLTVECKNKGMAKKVARMLVIRGTARNVTLDRKVVTYEQMSWSCVE